MRAVIPHNRAVPIREKYLSDSRNALRSNALSRGRSRLVGAAFLAGFVALVVRAFWVQTINDGFYRQQGELRQVRELPVHGSRGRIYDRSGRPLAVSLPMRTLWIDAYDQAVTISPQQAVALGKLLDLEPNNIEAIFAQRRGFAYLKRQVPVDDLGRVPEETVVQNAFRALP